VSSKKLFLFGNCVKQKVCQAKRKLFTKIVSSKKCVKRKEKLFINVQGEVEKEKAKVKGKWK
jgi:hypothetical protein